PASPASARWTPRRSRAPRSCWPPAPRSPCGCRPDAPWPLIRPRPCEASNIPLATPRMHSSDTLPTRLDLPEDRERARASSAPCRLLVADDQPDVLEALRLLLKGEGYQIDTAASPAGVVAALEDKEFD